MKKTFRYSLAAATLASALTFASSAQAAASANADAKAQILSSLTLAQAAGTSLDFGQIAPNGAGTVKVDAQGTRTCSALLECVGTPNPVTFNVTGTANASVAVTLPVAAVTLSNGTGGSMSLGSFTSYAPNGLTLVGGATTFNVGGTLSVGAAQAVGSYTGQFAVSVDYN